MLNQPVPPASFTVGSWLTGAVVGSPHQVLPTITSIRLEYRQPPDDPFGRRTTTGLTVGDPEEHWLREVGFEASYVPGSWHVDGPRSGSLQISIAARLRDNTPTDDNPEDPFIADATVHALCI